MATYTSGRAANFFRVTQKMVESEIRFGDTVSFVSQVDLSQVEAIRRRSPAGQKPSYTAFVLKALALALREFPYANRRLYRPWALPFVAPRIQHFDSCDVSVTCERQVDGVEVALFADVLRDADRLPLAAIAAWLRKLASADLDNNKQWRLFWNMIQRLPSPVAGLLVRLPVWSPRLWSRYRGAAATISSPAKYGADQVITSWTSPVGVSFGLVAERPVVRNGEVVPRPTFQLYFNYDRRLMAGAQAVRVHAHIAKLLTGAEQHLLSHPEDAPYRNQGDDIAAVGGGQAVPGRHEAQKRMVLELKTEPSPRPRETNTA